MPDMHQAELWAEFLSKSDLAIFKKESRPKYKFVLSVIALVIISNPPHPMAL